MFDSYLGSREFFAQISIPATMGSSKLMLTAKKTTASSVMNKKADAAVSVTRWFVS
jgi:hypothetical protein